MSSPPTTLGQYQIIREIARSNDIVYEAYDPLMDRRVALKELNMPSGLTDAQKEDRIQRFDREAKAAGRLAHPNIMRVFQVANDGVRHFMAMEYLDGHTLRNEIDTKGFLPVDRAVEIATAVLKGLGHAHANGVVHRDIKPDNIQLLSTGEIKITDFGIARLTFQPNLTMDGQVFGTPSYMSPEQVVGKEIDARSDLFSVGVLLYEMIGGQKPFGGDSVVAITYAIMNNEPAVLTQVNHSLWQVIHRALDKSPALRYASAQEMIDALDQASKPQSVVLDPVLPQAQFPTPGAQFPAPPPVLTPYNPYGPAQGAAPAPPPVVYPYNPYQSGMGGAMAPHTPGFPQQGFPQAPVYYPPPPRRPLMKPETKHFIGKLFLTFIVMGTALAVVWLFLVGIQGALKNANEQRQDQQTISQIHNVISGKQSLQEKIDTLENLIGSLKNEAFRNEQKRQLAALYEELGKKQMDALSMVDAESSFKRATELEPDNPKLMTDLAVLYQRQAGLQPDVSNAVELFRAAAESWQSAANLSQNNTADYAKYIDASAQMYLAMGQKLFNAGQYGDAHDAATQGMQIADPNSSTYGQLSSLADRAQEYGINQYNR